MSDTISNTDTTVDIPLQDIFDARALAQWLDKYQTTVSFFGKHLDSTYQENSWRHILLEVDYCLEYWDPESFNSEFESVFNVPGVKEARYHYSGFNPMYLFSSQKIILWLADPQDWTVIPEGVFQKFTQQTSSTLTSVPQICVTPKAVNRSIQQFKPDPDQEDSESGWVDWLPIKSQGKQASLKFGLEVSHASLQKKYSEISKAHSEEIAEQIIAFKGVD